MGMSDEIDAVFTVSCYACGDIASSHSITPNIESKPKFINHLRSQGWHYTQRHGWQCKPCQGAVMPCLPSVDAPGWHYTQRYGWQCKPCQGPRTND